MTTFKPTAPFRDLSYVAPSSHHTDSARQLGPPSPTLATPTSEGSGLAPPTASPSPSGVTWGLKWTVGTLQARAGQEEEREAEEQGSAPQTGAGLGRDGTNPPHREGPGE